eukprot:TRINITY_DN47542_c0_g1_i1.p1 TRINITY_DN47542_c0_g1~~TRINITY_DN47542_c0_g1_i1.p1  ORF type:complete len:517 (-),score=97.76 TRINITY_DN47542_c0_g1_i1:287-1837(-)
MTVRPDCFHDANLTSALFAPDEDGYVPHIVVRDSAVGTDCFNSGFLALRKTPLAKHLLRSWQSKLQWPGALHGDQGALAETLLEVLDVERRLLASQTAADLQGTTGYNNQCVGFLFPDTAGLASWGNYCDCFQYHLSKIGGFARRKSRLVRFVDPRMLDVNFVPNSMTPIHQRSLRRMRLMPWQPARSKRHTTFAMPRLTPLFVHWAGLANRTAMMKEYLVRRFGMRPTWFVDGRTLNDRCLAVRNLQGLPGSCSGELGTDIEYVFQGWDHLAKLDHLRDPEKEEAASESFAEHLRHVCTTDEAAMENPSLALTASFDPPDRATDGYVVTSKFRKDLLARLAEHGELKATRLVEIGAYLGYTTSFLAKAMRSVLSVEREETYFKRAQQLLSPNCTSLWPKIEGAEVLHFDTARHDWEILAERSRSKGGADAVLIDGTHSYEAVLNDLILAIFGNLGLPDREGRPRFVILDDHPVRAEVVQAASDFVKLGLLRLGPTLGEKEGVLCYVAPFVAAPKT